MTQEVVTRSSRFALRQHLSAALREPRLRERDGSFGGKHPRCSGKINSVRDWRGVGAARSSANGPSEVWSEASLSGSPLAASERPAATFDTALTSSTTASARSGSSRSCPGCGSFHRNRSRDRRGGSAGGRILNGDRDLVTQLIAVLVVQLLPARRVLLACLLKSGCASASLAWANDC